MAPGWQCSRLTSDIWSTTSDPLPVLLHGLALHPSVRPQLPGATPRAAAKHTVGQHNGNAHGIDITRGARRRARSFACIIRSPMQLASQAWATLCSMGSCAASPLLHPPFCTCRVSWRGNIFDDVLELWCYRITSYELRCYHRARFIDK